MTEQAQPAPIPLGVPLQEFTERIIKDLEEKVERVFAERETSAEFKRLALVEALDKAATSVEQKLIAAKVAADEREGVVQNRLDKLESGGAPFANRLDEGLTKIRADVDTLNVDAVRTKVLDALREQTAQEQAAQKRQVRLIGYAAALALFASLAVPVAVKLIG